MLSELDVRQTLELNVLVLILILLDHALRAGEFVIKDDNQLVLILILLDHALREQKC